jgi:hypothetical protein
MAALLGMIARPGQPKSTPAVIAMATITASRLKLLSVYLAIWAAYCRGTEELVYRGYGLRRPWLVVQGEAIMTTATRHGDLQQPGRAQPSAKSRIGLIVALSMAAGLIAAVVLVAMPFIPARENVLTGVVLLAFALGWALLAVLSTRFSDQPQRWAAAPATFMAVAGLVSLSGSAAVQAGFSWVWPPVLFGLVVWIFLRVRRQLRSRIGRWLLYPVLAVLMFAAIGGGYQTVRESLDAKAYPPPGQLIEVRHRLHLHCTGSGGPTVVLEPGGGGASSDFAWIAPAVARDTRVCVYDRAGRGWSDATDGPQDVPTLPRTCSQSCRRSVQPPSIDRLCDRNRFVPDNASRTAARSRDAQDDSPQAQVGMQAAWGAAVNGMNSHQPPVLPHYRAA